MIELSWGQLRNNNLGGALHKIQHQPMPFKTTLKVLNIIKAVEKEQKLAEDAAEVVRKKYMVQNKETKNMELKEGEGVKDEFEKTNSEFVSTRARFKIPKIELHELEGIELSAVELHHLEPFLNEPVENESTEATPIGLKAVPAEMNEKSTPNTAQ